MSNITAGFMRIFSVPVRNSGLNVTSAGNRLATIQAMLDLGLPRSSSESARWVPSVIICRFRLAVAQVDDVNMRARASQVVEVRGPKVWSQEPGTKIQFIAQVPRAFSDSVCRRPGYDGIGRHITGHNSAARYACALPDGNPWHDNGAVADPHMIANLHVAAAVFEMRRLRVVTQR